MILAFNDYSLQNQRSPKSKWTEKREKSLPAEVKMMFKIIIIIKWIPNEHSYLQLLLVRGKKKFLLFRVS